MNIKRSMATLLILVVYLSFMLGLNVTIIQETERLNKETQVIVDQIIDNLEEMEEIYLQRQNQE